MLYVIATRREQDTGLRLQRNCAPESVREAQPVRRALRSRLLPHSCTGCARAFSDAKYSMDPRLLKT